MHENFPRFDEVIPMPEVHSKIGCEAIIYIDSFVYEDEAIDEVSTVPSFMRMCYELLERKSRPTDMQRRCLFVVIEAKTK
jgi:hypothetical protein